jgi:uncharacterized Zn finger protein
MTDKQEQRSNSEQLGEPVAKIETRTALLRCPRCGNADKLRVDIEYAPQQRTAAVGEDSRRAWVGLSYEEAKEIYSCIHGYDAPKRISEAIEAKLKEKNGG